MIYGHFINLQDTYSLITPRPIAGQLQEQMDFSLSSTEQLKIIASTLCRMGKFFNEMTQLCLLELSERDSLRERHRMVLNRESLRNFENSKRLEKVKVRELARERQSRMEKIKRLKPKHPVSSFFVFYREKGQEIAKAKGEILGSKIAKIVGEMWKGMSQAEREPYESKARQTRLKYEQEMASYRLKHSEDIARLKKYKREVKEEKRHKKETRQSHAQGSPQQGRQDVGEREPVDAVGPLSEEESVLELDDMSDSLDLKSQQSLAQCWSASAECKFEEHQKACKEQKIAKQQELQSLNDDEFKQPSELLQKLMDQVETVKQQHQEERHPIKLENEAKLSETTAVVPKQKVNRPKGPISSFLLFYKTEGKKLAEEHRLSLGPKTIKLASQLWKKMSASQKQKYEKLSEQSRSKYRQQVQEIKKSFGQDAFERRKARGGAKEKRGTGGKGGSE